MSSFPKNNSESVYLLGWYGIVSLFFSIFSVFFQHLFQFFPAFFVVFHFSAFLKIIN